jgi:dTDP-D-glucose 4,6-dehydratase
MRDTGFRPATPLEEGIKKFVAWYREYHGVPVQVLPAFDATVESP